MRYFSGGRLALALSVAAVFVQSGMVSAAGSDLRVVEAARKHDPVMIRGLVGQKADVNAAEADGSTALLWATYHADLDVVRMLIGAGANANAANRYGVTPLLQASRLSATAIVEALLAAGANPDVRLPEGETPLMAAAAVGDVRAVKLFVARGVNVNSQEVAQNQTALMWAAGGGHGDVIRVLLAAGAAPNESATPSTLPRTISGDAGGRMWTDHASGGLNAVMFAARQGHVDAIKALAEGKADLSVENPDHVTAMMLAVMNDHLDAADVLLQNGASTSDGSLYETVVLHNLRTNDTVGEATRPRPSHDNAMTPAEFAAHLLERGADPNRLATHTIHYDGTGGAGAAGVPTPINESPFARALRAQDVAVIRLMLPKGAKVNEPAGGVLPLALAIGAGGGRGFAGGFGAVPGAFRFAGERSPAAAVAALLDAGADVNAANEAGDTPLHSAAQIGNAEMIKVLVSRGAKLDARNMAGLTPLDVAMGKQPPGRGRAGDGGFPGRGGPAGPQPRAIAALRELMGLPPLSAEEMPKPAPRGGPPQ